MRCDLLRGLTAAVAVLVTFPLIGQGVVALPSAGQETILHALVRTGQKHHVQLGIVQLNDGALCKPAENLTPADSADVSIGLEQLAKQAGYEVHTSEGNTVVQPYFVPGTVIQAMEHQFAEFPELKDTMRGMGMMLDGWLQTGVYGAQGFGGSNAHGPDAEMLTLPKTVALTTTQLANRITGLGSQGVWIFHASQGDHGQVSGHLASYSYHDAKWALDRLNCQEAR